MAVAKSITSVVKCILKGKCTVKWDGAAEKNYHEMSQGRMTFGNAICDLCFLVITIRHTQNMCK